MDRRELSVNLRRVLPRDRRRARQVMAELIGPRGAKADLLPEKVNFVYRVAFASGGRDRLSRIHAQIAEVLPAEAWRRAHLEAMFYTGETAAVLPAAAAELAARPEDPQAWALTVRAKLVAGQVESAIEDCFAYLPQVPPGGPGTLCGFFVRFLLAAGHGSEIPRIARPHARANPAVRFFRRLQPAPMPRLPLYCINMDRDTARLARARTLMGDGVAFRRSPSVSGASLPDSFLAATGLEIAVPRRAQVGCHLGHLRAWERVAAEVEEGAFAVVAEDDALFIHGPGIGLVEAEAAARAAGLDLLFLQNEPAIFLLQPREAEDIALLPVEAPVAAAKARSFLGWGGEGYLLTPAGARRLIDMHMALGILGPLDWQIAIYAADDLSIFEGGAESVYGVVAERLAVARAREPGRFRIRGAVLNVGLMAQADLGHKTHNVEVALGAGA